MKYIYFDCFVRNFKLVLTLSDPKCKQQAELMALEKTSLLALRQDHEAFFKFTSGLDSAAKDPAGV